MATDGHAHVRVCSDATERHVAAPFDEHVGGE